ncbi:MAG: pyridoxal phosphate-dependent aminotransferase [Gammaproteobacteria bacterium]|nr:pyridoxal phosphate-dependent aminotransferase [Gammaproteobacteria bacterium]
MTADTASQPILRQFPPMGIYEVLFSFLDSAGTYMGEPGTHPWVQGFPLTTQLPNGPELPGRVEFTAQDLKYPSATGINELITAIRDYYNEFYDAGISSDNVAVFAGGRPGIFATVAFLAEDVEILIEETEYTPYFDMLRLLKRKHNIIPSNQENNFRPGLDEYRSVAAGQRGRSFVIRSNPCNPTGIASAGEDLKLLIDFCSKCDRGAIIDEAYEFFQLPKPESAIKYIEDINQTNLFVIGAATKGLQVPGMRVGWVISSEENIKIFRNYSSIGMGGVARPSQLYVSKLLDIERVRRARKAVGEFYGEQRNRYREGLESLGIKLFTGEGGFYHWGRLPGNLTARELNKRLFEYKAAILPGDLCDMYRRGNDGPHRHFIRFSFGPLEPGSFDENMGILSKCLKFLV